MAHGVGHKAIRGEQLTMRDLDFKTILHSNPVGRRHGFYNRWLLISLCAHMDYIRHFNLLKAFGYNERVIKSDFFSEKDLVYIIRAQREMSNHLI